LIHQSHTPSSRDELKQRPNRLCRPELRCSAETPSGPCRAPRRPASLHCYWHDETLAEYRAKSCSKGGRGFRRGSSTAELARIDVATEEGLGRFRRAIMFALAQNRLTSGRARVLVDLARQEHEAGNPRRQGGWTRERIAALIGATDLATAEVPDAG
jgi:hypothetical protein